MAERKVALVTGSSSGIGEACVKLLSKKGYRVAVTGSNPDKVERVVRECASLSSSGQNPLGLVLDLMEPTNGALAVQKTIQHFGRLDVLVNNAGILYITSSEPASYPTYREIMTVNVDATVQASLAAAQELRRTRGNMIFISSVVSRKAYVDWYAYCMSKAAISMFAKCMTVELAPHVRVNTISPGPVETDLFGRPSTAGLSEPISLGMGPEQAGSAMADSTLMGRIARADEVADVVAYLISDQATFINGHELFVDGGYLLKPCTFSVQTSITSNHKN